MGYLIFFIGNFVIAYFIYDEANLTKPLLHSILLLIFIVVADYIQRGYKRKRDRLS